MIPSRTREVATDRPCQEQDDHHGSRDPERAVQVGVPVQHVEEVAAREDGGPASAQDLGGVDVEELRVEGEGPEVVFRGGRAGAAAGRVIGLREEGGVLGGGELATLRGRGGEVAVVEFEVVVG